MEKLFYKKSLSIMMIALTVVLVFLLVMLLVTLTQYASQKQLIEEINGLLAVANDDVEAAQKLIEYRKTDDYVIQWAVSMGYISEDVLNYVPE